MNGYSAANGGQSSYIPPLDQSGTANGVQAPVIVPLGPTNQPKVLIRSLNKDEAVFHLSGVEMAFANSLRRVIMADVPTIGAYSNLNNFQKMEATEGLPAFIVCYQDDTELGGRKNEIHGR